MKKNMRVISKLSGFALLLLSISSETVAIPISNASTGLASPDEIVDFSGLSNGTVITNQFASQGVLFNGLFVNKTLCVSTITAPCANSIDGNLSNVYSIMFTQSVEAATLQLLTNTGATTFTALYGGSIVELFNASTNRDSVINDYYGFTGIVFDEIQYTISATNSFFALDNVQYIVARVPEPPILALLILGLFGIGVARKTNL